MKFTFVTLFKNLIECYFSDSILKNAVKSKKIEIKYLNPRDFSKNKHKKTDDYLIGGGAGLLFSPQPLFDALETIKKDSNNAHIIFTTPAAKRFNQNDAKRLSKKDHIVFVCGRYEGIDERVIELFADELFSIGDFILSGGEIAALAMCDAIARNIDGVLGNSDSLKNESFENNLLEGPSFTKPPNFKGIYPPSELLKGNHSNIHSLKKRLSIAKTRFYRPDLYKKFKIEDKQ